MPNPIVAVAGIGAGSSVIGGISSARAARSAASSQTAAAMAGIEEQRRQFDAIRELMAPFVSAGTGAIADLAAIAGVSGPDEQAAAIQQIAQGPEMQALVEQQEMALLQNASATGGLRGGNTQRALAELRPQLLAQQIGTQYGRLGGIAQIGQAGAAQQAAAGQAFGQSTANLLGQAGAAQAGGALGVANAWQQGLSGVNRAVGQYLGSMPSTQFGGAASGITSGITNWLGF